ncbi:putative secondary metabolism biosynthetic enzyme [Sporothrix stenoceras]|uniref:Secondary metabolism biosynthetic enzyme n=1 Tax=Sporothrix stenoceras TaxID=5173 RepID=A0ABR3YYB0_9PEZI
MATIDLPSQLDLLAVGKPDYDVPVYPYDKTFDEARQDPFVILHTSGSTGLPKPIRVPNGSLATVDAQHLLPAVEGRLTHAQYFDEPRIGYSTFPNFHSAGMVFCFALPFFYKLSIVMGPPLVPVNLDLVNAMFDHANITGSLLAPSTLEQISKDPPSLNRIAKTDFTVVGGAPLNKVCGDKINGATTIINIMGVTEGSLFPVVQAEPEDWHYHHFHPGGGYTFVPRTDDLYELVQTRSSELHMFQAFLQTFPDDDAVATKDLYAKHPTKPGRWLYRGRVDDVIVLSNGEKVNPIDMETCLGSHPAVKAALIVGAGQFQVAAILELMQPLSSDKETATFWESLWPYVDKANREAPAHGQLHRDHIILASADKPFALAGKDTVLRGVTTRLYEKDIEDLYAKRALAVSNPDSVLPGIDLTSLSTIRKSLLALLSETINVQPGQLKDTDDLFVNGLDSLSVLTVYSSLRSALEKYKTVDGKVSPSAVTIAFIYSHPTLEKLALAIDHLVRPDSQAANGTSQESVMQDLLDKFTKDLPQRAPQPAKLHERACVVLTGSTGSLGVYLLDTLLSNRNVGRVICLNRSANAYERHLKEARDRGFQSTLLELERKDASNSRTLFFQADLSKPLLGLSQEGYYCIVTNVTHIIHNQWPVNFHMQVSSFEPHLRGVRNLVDAAIASPNSPEILFVSSVGVVQGQKTNDSVPEKLLYNFSDAEGGYGQSKLVAELILAKASERSGLNAAICRFGQIGGPVGTSLGSWKRQEWLPSIIASSEYLGKIPAKLSSLDRVDWVPVNHASKIICELAGFGDGAASEENANVARVYHVVNPSSVPWSTLVPSVIKGLGFDLSKDVVSWNDWLTALEDSEAAGDYENNSGLSLLPFYRGTTKACDEGRQLPVLQTGVTQTRSPTLKSLEAATPAWMDEWIKQWNF